MNNSLKKFQKYGNLDASHLPEEEFLFMNLQMCEKSFMNENITTVSSSLIFRKNFVTNLISHKGATSAYFG